MWTSNFSDLTFVFNSDDFPKDSVARNTQVTFAEKPQRKTKKIIEIDNS